MIRPILMVTAGAMLVLATFVAAEAQGRGHGHGHGHGRGHGRGGGGGGGASGGPLPILGATVLGQIGAGVGAYVVWRRRRKKQPEKPGDGPV